MLTLAISIVVVLALVGEYPSPDVWAVAGFGLATICIIASIGLFEANAIQFGTDQLLEAPSTQLSAFIHWFFWSTHLGQQVVFCMAIITITIFLPFLSNKTYPEIQLIVMEWVGGLLVLWLSCVIISCYLLQRSKHGMYIGRVGINPFKQMKKVLAFAWRNKFPLNRSAFTYCEERLPTRIDLGKEQYGGPFTTEEVEDVKTFFRLLFLLATLFGYHVAGDGFLAARNLQRYSCPTLNIWYLLAFNLAFASSLVVLILIPLLRHLPQCHRYTPNMLKRIGIGLFMLLLQDLVYSYLMAVPVYEQSSPLYSRNASVNRLMFCFDCRAERYGFEWTSFCDHTLQPVDESTFLWLIFPQILNGTAQVLVHMTTLEFICAQAPRTMQGLLIGLWYAMFSF